MSEQMMYVFFERDSGRVTGVSNSPDENRDHVMVPISEVISILDGNEPTSNYMVQYNPKTKTLEFASKFEYVLDAYSINDFIYEIPEQGNDADIIITQDIPNSCWRIEIGKELKNNLRSKGVSLNTNIMFSITEKGDPNILYKTLFVDFGRLVSDNYFIAPFDMPFESTNQPISVYTSRRFDTYQYKRIYE